MLDARGAGRAHRKIFDHVWAQVHRLGPKDKHTRAKLAAAAGCTEDYAGRCVADLRAWGLFIVGLEGESGRWTHVMIGRPYFVGLTFAYERMAPLPPKEISTPEKSSPSHYKATPQGYALRSSGLYSATDSARLPGFTTTEPGRLLRELGLLGKPLAPPGPT